MFGRRAIIADWTAEQELNDSFTADEDRGAMYVSGANQYEAGHWSYSLLDADLAIHGSSLPIDSYHQTGWLAFA